MTEGGDDLGNGPPIHFSRFNGIKGTNLDTVEAAAADIRIDTGHLRVENQLIFRKDFAGPDRSRTRCRHGIRNVFRELTGAGKEYSLGHAFDRLELRMGLRIEAILIVR